MGIAFTQEQEINVAIDYEDSELLPAGTPLSIERYNVTGIAKFAKEMEEKGLGKPKVSLQFDLSTSGLATLVKAEAAVEETYTVEEEVEVEDENQDEDEDEEKEAEATEEADETEKAESTEETNNEGKGDDTKEKEEDGKKTETKPKKKKMKTIKVEKEKKRVHKATLSV